MLISLYFNYAVFRYHLSVSVRLNVCNLIKLNRVAHVFHGLEKTTLYDHYMTGNEIVHIFKWKMNAMHSPIIFIHGINRMNQGKSKEEEEDVKKQVLSIRLVESRSFTHTFFKKKPSNELFRACWSSFFLSHSMISSVSFPLLISLLLLWI